MNRRIRSSSRQRHRLAARVSMLCAALGLAACSSDLFHDTKWQSRCDTEPDAAICPQGTGGAGGTSSTASASSSADASSASSASSSAESSSSASSTAGAGGGTSTSSGTSMMATSSSTGP